MQQQNRDLQWYAKELGLTHLASQMADVMKIADHQRWSLEQTIQTLLEGEYERRLAGRQKARIKTAGFSQIKYLEQLDRNELPEGIKHLLPRLETLDFIHEHRNVVLYGNPGTGKTHVATALAIKACMEGMYVLFNHLSLRADTKSTIITTNLAFDRWGEIIKDKVLVTALVDRLTHNAFLVNMNGESYRLKETMKFNEQNR